jgi:hypothetical protein
VLGNSCGQVITATGASMRGRGSSRWAMVGMSVSGSVANDTEHCVYSTQTRCEHVMSPRQSTAQKSLLNADKESLAGTRTSRHIRYEDVSLNGFKT